MSTLSFGNLFSNQSMDFTVGFGATNIVTTTDHASLSNRDGENQHPISSITGLEDALSEVAIQTFVFTQSVASDTWTIVHTMNKMPSVSVIDSAGSAVVGDVHYDSITKITITFSAPFSGKAYLN